MPIYGEAKKRNMARSILPSTARKGAREDLAQAKRSARSKVNQSLSRFKGYADEVVDLYDEDSDDLEFYPDHRISEIMWERRASDKVGPVQRWAVAITKDIRKQDRLSYMMSLMPDNTIGRHACDHVAWMEEFDVEHDPRLHWYGSFGYYGFTREERAWMRNCEIANLVERMKRIFEVPRAHKRFNDSDVAWTRERIYVESHKAGRDAGIPGYELSYDRQNNSYYYLKRSKRPLLNAEDIESFLKEFIEYDSIFRWGTGSYERLEEVLNEIGV